MKKSVKKQTPPACNRSKYCIVKRLPLTVMLATLTVAGASILTAPAQAGLYRWVDSSGKVHFSDKVPPTIAQKGHTELTLSGVETKKVLSAEELKQQKEEKKKQTEALSEKKRLEEALKQEKMAQIKHDKFLLSTFDNRNELIQYYKDKFAMLTGTANILLARNESLEKKLKALRLREKSAKSPKIKESLIHKIDNVEHSIQQYDKALDENEQERAQIKQQYEKDLIRFTEISG